LSLVAERATQRRVDICGLPHVVVFRAVRTGR
jgi:hypothetical protein